MKNKKFSKFLKKIDVWDLALDELSAVSFILFLITFSGTLMALVRDIHWAWFLGASIIFALRPLMKYFKN